MPYFKIGEKSVYDFLREPKFHFLIFTNDATDFQNLKVQIESVNGDLIDCQIFPLAPHVHEIFGADKSFSMLLRPDNHVGYIAGRISFDDLKSYPFLKVPINFIPRTPQV